MKDTLMGAKIKEALEEKKLDKNSFIWKGEKKLNSNGTYTQYTKKLMDMDQQELSNCYEHCKTMLFNKDYKNPGRYLVLKNISDQKDRCGAELFLRYLEKNKDLNISRFNLTSLITEFLSVNRETLKNSVPTLDMMFSSLPSEYSNLPISLIMDGCLDRLGTFNKKHITRAFILKQGIWLTPTESKELVNINGENFIKNKIEVLREQLNIKPVEKLYINSKGINYTQLRSMLNLKPNKKYSDLTSDQLFTLRYRILFNLEEIVQEHIVAWEKRMEEIEIVLNSKGFS